MAVVIMEWTRIRQEYPEFEGVWDQVEADLKAQAEQRWGLKVGGWLPRDEGAGVTTIRPRFIQLGTNTAVEDWNRNLATGWKTAWNNSVIEDAAIGPSGLILPDVQNKMSAFQFIAAGVTFPVLAVDGYVDTMTNPVAVFPAGLSIFQENAVRLDVLSRQDGNKRLILWGPAVAKKKTLIAQTPT